LYDIVARRSGRGVPVRWWLAAGAIVVLAFLPWLAIGTVENALRSSKTVRADQPPWFSGQWLSLLRDVNRFNNGAIGGLLSPAPKWTFVAGAALFILPMCIALWTLAQRVRRGLLTDWPSVALMASLWLVPHSALFALALAGMQYDLRYALFCTVPYYVLAAWSITSIRSRLLRHALLAAIVILGSLALQANYFVPYKEDYRAALNHVAKAQQPGDGVVYFPFDKQPAQWTIYHKAVRPPVEIRLAAPPSELSRFNRIWLIKYTRVGHAIPELKRLDGALRASFNEVDRRSHFWVETIIYERRGASQVARGDGFR
jgi:hypothetical protein